MPISNHERSDTSNNIPYLHKWHQSPPQRNLYVQNNNDLLVIKPEPNRMVIQPQKYPSQNHNLPSISTSVIRISPVGSSRMNNEKQLLMETLKKKSPSDRTSTIAPTENKKIISADDLFSFKTSSDLISSNPIEAEPSSYILPRSISKNKDSMIDQFSYHQTFSLNTPNKPSIRLTEEQSGSDFAVIKNGANVTSSQQHIMEDVCVTKMQKSTATVEVETKNESRESLCSSKPHGSSKISKANFKSIPMDERPYQVTY